MKWQALLIGNPSWATSDKTCPVRAQEFFQLLMRELFEPQYGMFALEPNTRTHYFRPSSLELHMEFELVGLLLGLAVYNNHILEVSFPPVVYKCALVILTHPLYNNHILEVSFPPVVYKCALVLMTYPLYDNHILEVSFPPVVYTRAPCAFWFACCGLLRMSP